jgi:hypothetical protein
LGRGGHRRLPGLSCVAVGRPTGPRTVVTVANISRRHHTVPRFYLENFARDGQVGTVVLPGDRRFQQSVRKASTSNDFYSLGSPTTEGADEFERVLARLEGMAAPVVKKVLGGVWPLGTEDRALLAEFVAVQYLRGPNHRIHMQNMRAQFSRMDISLRGKDWMANEFRERLGRELEPDEVDRLWEQATRQEGPPLTISSAQHVKSIVETLPEVYWYFAARPWSLLRFERQRLLACDTPVCLIPSDDAPAWAGVGLLNAWALALPLSRTTALLMTDPGPIADRTTREHVATGALDLTPPPSVKWARVLRGATLGNARQFIYHHPDDTQLVPSKLPEPALSEIVAPSNDFVAMGEALRARYPD